MERKRVWIPVLLLVCMFARTTAARSEELAGEFLKALRNRQYYDVALLYLDRLASSQHVPAELADTIGYQRALTLVQAASVESDPEARQQKLAAARDSFQAFIRAHPNHDDAPIAQRQLGQMLSGWARIELERAKKTDRDDLRQQSAKLSAEAYAALLLAKEKLKAVLLKLKDAGDVTMEDAARTKRRKMLQGEYLDVQVLAGQALEDQADAIGQGSPEYTKRLQQAEALDKEIFTKYAKLGLVGSFQARLNEARILTKLARREEALGVLKDDLLGLTSDTPIVRKLKTQALLLAIDCWQKDPQGGKNYDTAIRMGQSWLATMRPVEAEDPDWLQLQLDVAKLHKEYAALLKKSNPRDTSIREHLAEATRLAHAVAKVPSVMQTAALTLVAELPRGERNAQTADKPVPKTFEEARKAGEEALSNMRSAQFIVENVPARLKREKDPEQKIALRKTIEDAQTTIRARQQKAGDYFALALKLADSETPLDDLNYVRYSLSYLRFLSGNYYDAATYGAFCARKYPNAPLARKAAEIALAAYLKLYAKNVSDDKQFETEHVVSIADYIVVTWPGKPEATTAINTMIPFLIRQGNLAQARQYVERIPPDSAQRGSAELRVGQAIWQDYVRGIEVLRKAEQTATGQDTATANPELAQRKRDLESLKKAALDILRSGVDRMKKLGSIDPNLPRSVLVLAQMQIDTDHARDAFALLEDEKIGPLQLIARHDPSVKDPQLVEQTYRVALSAIVGALPKATDTEQRAKLIQRARAMMQTLRAQIGERPEDQKRLVAIFFSMARGIERQLTLLDDPADRRVLSQGFAAFLDEVGTDSTDYRILNWVAQAYTSLGNGVSGDKDSKSIARGYYDKAIATFDRLLKQTDLDPKIRRQLLVNRASALRQAGRYQSAVEALGKILAENDRDIGVQVEAATTYQKWAEAPGQSEHYLDATRGALPDKTKKNTIWGWNLLARKTQPYPEFRDQFHDARYNMAFCYYKFAMRQRDAAQKSKYLNLAQRTITSTQQLYPALGSPEQRARYDALIRQIQQALKQKPTGLPRQSTNTRRSTK